MTLSLVRNGHAPLNDSDSRLVLGGLMMATHTPENAHQAAWTIPRTDQLWNRVVSSTTISLGDGQR